MCSLSPELTSSLMMSSPEYDDAENFHMRRNISYDDSNQDPKLPGNVKCGKNGLSSSRYCDVALTVAVAVLVLGVVASCV